MHIDHCDSTYDQPHYIVVPAGSLANEEITLPAKAPEERVRYEIDIHKRLEDNDIINDVTYSIGEDQLKIDQLEVLGRSFRFLLSGGTLKNKDLISFKITTKNGELRQVNVAVLIAPMGIATNPNNIDFTLGVKGDKGDAATIKVGTITTGAPDTPAVISNSGDEHNAIFDFTLPKGEKGDKGDAGPQGKQGEKGEGSSKLFLSGKKVSIIGDSISTFKGYIPDDGRPYVYPTADVDGVEKTWWMQVIDQTGASFGSNDSWSGRCLAGDPQSNKSCLLASLKTIDSDTDVGLVLIGVNDFRMGSTLNPFDPTKKDPQPATDFSDALCVAMAGLAQNYPNTRFVWISPLGDFTWPEGFPQLVTNKYGLTLWKYDDVLRDACAFYGNLFIDARNIFSYLQANEFIDGLHPKLAATTRLAKAVIHAITNIV